MLNLLIVAHVLLVDGQKVLGLGQISKVGESKGERGVNLAPVNVPLLLHLFSLFEEMDCLKPSLLIKAFLTLF